MMNVTVFFGGGGGGWTIGQSSCEFVPIKGL